MNFDSPLIAAMAVEAMPEGPPKLEALRVIVQRVPVAVLEGELLRRVLLRGVMLRGVLLLLAWTPHKPAHSASQGHDPAILEPVKALQRATQMSYGKTFLYAASNRRSSSRSHMPTIIPRTASGLEVQEWAQTGSAPWVMGVLAHVRRISHLRIHHGVVEAEAGAPQWRQAAPRRSHLHTHVNCQPVARMMHNLGASAPSWGWQS